MPFKLISPFQPTGDQPQAIEALLGGLNAGVRAQTLLGVTGSGKTFTIANLIAKSGKPALILSHNKTLAAQLYEELKRFFPNNAVHYFVSYYDYYQPEAYIPQSDTYIEKDVKINEELDRLRHAATQAVLSRNDVIVVASVSAIYNIGSPEDYRSLSLQLVQDQRITRRKLFERLTDLQYTRNDVDLLPGAFRVRGEHIEIASVTGEKVFVLTLGKDHIMKLTQRGAGLDDPEQQISSIQLFPAKFWVAPQDRLPLVLTNIEAELTERVKLLEQENKLLEAQRLAQRTREDIAMMRENGYCHGIENYSRQMEFRESGSPPFTLLDYFNTAFGKDGWLTIIDESHQTLPQIRGMVHGDWARKDMLIAHGFRLPSARDNRPLMFEEFLERKSQTIFTSATPGAYEKEVSQRLKQAGQKKIEKGVVEQMVRPTGLLDPKIEIRPTKDQLATLVKEIEDRIAKKQRTLVLTLTKRLAEEFTEWLAERKIKVEYLHADIETLERPEVLHRLRAGEVDVVVGINLLREGLDLPEVSLVAIFDADQEGFLRNDTTLIQIMGRAARHSEGRVLLFADTITGSMQRAIAETERRRHIQERWNREHNIVPRSISKPLERSTLIGRHEETEVPHGPASPELLKQLRKEMQDAVKKLEFEKAAKIRDVIARLSSKKSSPNLES